MKVRLLQFASVPKLYVCNISAGGSKGAFPFPFPPHDFGEIM